MKRFLSSLLILCLITMFLPISALATSESEKIPPIEEAFAVYDLNEKVALAFFVEENKGIQSFAYNTKSDTGTGYFYLKSSGAVLGNFKCVGKFSYDRTICNVTSVSASTSNCADGYKMKYTTTKDQVSPTYASATGEFQLYKLGMFGSESLDSSAVIKIYCNQNGSTTVEFNGS